MLSVIATLSPLRYGTTDVRRIEERVVKKLREQAGQHGVSMEEEHRCILRESLLGKKARRPSFKEALLAMPNVGDDEDFERRPQIARAVELLAASSSTRTS